MRFTAPTIAFLTFSLLLTSVSHAQRERRRQFVEDLLQGLIESQLDKGGDKHQGHDHGQSQARPTQRPVQVPPEVTAAREELGHVGGSVNDLVKVLQHESYASPGYRQPLAEAMHIKALTDALYRNCAFYGDIRLLREGYADIDQKWRSLSHRLKQARGVSRKVLTAVDEVESHTAEMAQVIGLAPQIDRTELVRLTSTMSAEFRHLLEDVSYELNRHPKRNQLLITGRDLMTRVRESTALIDRGDYESIVAAWQSGQAGWRNYAAQLRRLGNDRIRRGVNKVEQSGRQINAALWLPVPMDRDYVNNMVVSIENDIDHICESITVKDLMACKDPNGYLRTIRDFQASCQTFSQSIGKATATENLVWDYRMFSVAWNDVVARSAVFTNPEVQRHLRTGTDSIAMLEQTFGAGLELSRGEIQQVIAEMGDLCNRTVILVNRNIGGATHYSAQMRNDIRREVIGLQASLHNLHNNYVGRQSEQIARKDLETTIAHWKRLKPMMKQCRDSDKQAFREIRGELEPLFVKMQVVYSK